MASRDSTTHWVGGLKSGKGTVNLESSNAGQYDVTFPRRVGEPEGTTSPEELIAAAQSSCLAMNLAGTLEKEGLSPKSIDVRTRVTVNPADGGLNIDTVDVEVRAEVDGVDDEQFQRIAQVAEDTCPVSKALAGTTITMNATLGR